MPIDQAPVDPEEVYELVDGDGNVAYRTGAHVEKALAMGFRHRTTEEAVAGQAAESEEAFYSTPGQQAKAFVGSALSGATLGGSDLLDRYASTDDEWAATKLGREHNPKTALAGNLVGAVGPALIPGAGAAGAIASVTPAGAVARLGAGLTKTAGGASLASRAGTAALGFGVEGGLQGAGQGVQKLVMADDPLTIEHAAAVLGSSALLGAAGGAVLGAGGVVASQAARSAAKGLARSRPIVKEATEGATAVPDDLVGLDAKGYNAAEKLEREALATKQVAEKAASADGLAQYQATANDANHWLVADGEARKLLVKSKNALRTAGDDVVGLQKNPYTLLKPLRVEAQAIRGTLAKADETLAALAAEDATLAATLAKRVEAGTEAVELEGKLARRFSDFTGQKMGKVGQVARADAEAFLGAMTRGEVQGARRAALDALPARLEQNAALQARIEAASIPKAELGSERLTQIADLRAELASGAGAKKGLLEQMAQGSIMGGVMSALPALPFGGVLVPLIGAKVASTVTGLVFGRGAKAIAEQGARTARAVDAFMDVGKKLAPAAPPLASKVLASVSFGEPAKLARGVKEAPIDSSLLGIYKKREAEIRSQIVAGPDGVPMMRPDARARVAERLAPMHVLSPRLADQVETMAARRLEFLASKLPQRPDFGVMQMGPDTWTPSDMEMRKFARFVAAVEDPGSVEERLAHGTITPEDAEAYAKVYPERLADLKRQVIERLPELRATLPSPRKVALSILTGIPVDPAMQPSMIRRLQAQFGAEQGTEGGMQAPRAAPQGGSVARDSNDLTPAQSRAAG